MLSYEEFKEQVVERIGEITGKRVVCNNVKKNNGVLLDGITIITPDCNVSPNLYLNMYYEMYKETMDVEEDALGNICTIVIKEYEQHMPKKNVDLELLYDYENVKKNIKIKMLNIELNKNLLDDLVYITYMDLAITFYIEIESFEFGSGYIGVNNVMADMWGVNAEALYEQAMINLDGEFEITAMSQIIPIKSFSNKSDEMYVMTLKDKTYGAAGIVMTDLLQRFAEDIGIDNVVIIPSSIHELILISKRRFCSLVEVNDMIESVNSSEVDDTEVLSNHCYVYDRVNNRVYM